jgi:hypothetical protein
MALSTVVKNFRDGRIRLKRPAHSLLVPVANGDFQISGLKDRLAEAVAYESRGQIDSLRHTTRIYPTGSFSFKLREFSEVTAGTVIDFLLKTGFFAAATSTAVVPGEVDQLSIEFEVEGTDLGDATDHDFEVTGVHPTSVDISEGDPSSVTVAFTVYGAFTGDIVATQ